MSNAREELCPRCGHVVRLYRNPLLTVDIIIEMPGQGIVLIERKNPPFGWAIPGGFVDYGESLEAAAIREAREETGMDLVNLKQFHAYSDPQRDPRGHTVSVVFTALGNGVPKAGDDAKNLQIFSLDRLPENLVFDHALILSHYSQAKSKR
ncbi:MAG: NUDIX hydrolase [Deltaproteobacteria bacterium]|nr:NUDIX hydrolase [Deltaproteobacteria bacterium]MDA8306882.1 NUDIX hydrolase [Deltaproteobacteria bacterium]